jgi:2-polyprenyl-3-methyl-5-hydroxy-6-metoxy-1,4-benzoquinol methylase/uncharacterized protein YbaR (Trm112 family)
LTGRRQALGAALSETLRCIECGGHLSEAKDALTCVDCSASYPVRGGVPRFVPKTLGQADTTDPEALVKRETADSFGYEWSRFGELRPEWRRNFLEYMHPHPPEFFRGLRVLDVGTGSGRHARIAAELGAEVATADLGSAIEVARANLPPEVLTVQADAEALPFAPGSFDLVMSIGVLHHLPDTGRALRSLVRYAKRGGRVRVYLYWKPEQGWHRAMLAGVSVARKVTTRLPHRLLHALSYPIAAALWIAFVGPYKFLSSHAATKRLATALPLKTYGSYPFGVLVNDTFDRFSAPIERRFERSEVLELMRSAGLEDIEVWPNHGWIAEGVVRH